ncbi:MAG: BCD family MFS transporter [Pseudomonadota bacterium]
MISPRADATAHASPLSWFAIFRLGLVQTALGAIVVLTTATLNRVMVVELSLAASIPGALVGLHYAVQILRPRWGFGSDIGGRRTPWIIAGMAILAAGAILAAIATALLAEAPLAGALLVTGAFVIIGIGVGCAGTTLLALLASRTAPARRAPAATIVWLMMIAGFVITAIVAGANLDPFSFTRLIWVTIAVCAVAFAVTIVALFGVEGRQPTSLGRANADHQSSPAAPIASGTANARFLKAVAETWADATARRFTIFVFLSMLAYSAQDLILEPFAGLVFAMTPGESTQLSGVQHGGVFIGMALVGAIAGLRRRGDPFALQRWVVAGCCGSALSLVALAFGGYVGPGWPLATNVFLLGFANGIFAVAAIASMMALSSEGGSHRTGTRMGLWGAAQAIAFGLGGLMGTILVDIAGLFAGSPATAYGTVFILEGLVFVASAMLAVRLAAHSRTELRPATHDSQRGRRLDPILTPSTAT